MNKPHKHAELIKAWADGAEIQFLNQSSGDWVGVSDPCWHEGGMYRIKPPHQALKDAYAAGAKIQFLSRIHNKWMNVGYPAWYEDYEYRIKPEGIVYDLHATACKDWWGIIKPNNASSANLRITFDSETKELVNAEVIK